VHALFLAPLSIFVVTALVLSLHLIKSSHFLLCRLCKATNRPKLTCSKPNTQSNTSCQAKQSCQLLASNEIFGDSCPGTHKYLEVHYQCVPPANNRTLAQADQQQQQQQSGKCCSERVRRPASWPRRASDWRRRRRSVQFALPTKAHHRPTGRPVGARRPESSREFESLCEIRDARRHTHTRTRTRSLGRRLIVVRRCKLLHGSRFGARPRRHCRRRASIVLCKFRAVVSSEPRRLFNERKRTRPGLANHLGTIKIKILRASAGRTRRRGTIKRLRFRGRRRQSAASGYLRLASRRAEPAAFHLPFDDDDDDDDCKDDNCARRLAARRPSRYRSGAGRRGVISR
jgi:hypothetical protein